MARFYGKQVSGSLRRFFSKSYGSCNSKPSEIYVYFKLDHFLPLYVLSNTNVITPGPTLLQLKEFCSFSLLQAFIKVIRSWASKKFITGWYYSYSCFISKLIMVLLHNFPNVYLYKINMQYIRRQVIYSVIFSKK